MKLSQFKFKLPEERIAMEPTFHRDDSKLMVLHKKTSYANLLMKKYSVVFACIWY